MLSVFDPILYGVGTCVIKLRFLKGQEEVDHMDI